MKVGSDGCLSTKRAAQSYAERHATPHGATEKSVLRNTTVQVADSLGLASTRSSRMECL